MIRMNEERLPQNIWEWCTWKKKKKKKKKKNNNNNKKKNKKKKGKTSKFTDTKNLEWCPTGMREKGINNKEWIHREEWRREIKLQAQKVVKT